MKKGAKIALFSVAGFVVACLVLAVGAYFFVRTAAGSNFVLTQAKNYLASSRKMKLEYKAGRIDPFAFIHFENLKLTQATAETRMEVAIKSIDIRYSLSLFPRGIRFETFTVDEPSVLFHSTSKAAVPGGAAAPASGEKAYSIEELRRYVLSPTVRVAVKLFSVENLALDFDYQEPKYSVKAILTGVGGHASMKLLPGDDLFSGDFHTGSSGHLSLVADGRQAAMELAPQASAKWGAVIHQEKGKWIYEIQPSEMQFGAAELTASQGGEATGSRLAVGKVQVNSTAKLRVSTSSLFAFGPRSFEVVDFKGSFTTGEGSFERDVAGKKTQGRFASQESSFNTLLDKEFGIGFDSVTKGLFAEAYLTKPAFVEMKSTVRLSRDLKDLGAQASTFLEGIDLFHFNLTGKAGSGIHLEGKGEALREAKLARVIKSSAGLAQLGSIHASLTFTGDLKGNIPSFIEIDDEKNHHPAEGDLRIEIVQDKKGKLVAFEPMRLDTHLTRSDDALAFKSVFTSKSMQAYGSRLNELRAGFEGESKKDSLDAKLDASIPEVKSAYLKKPWTVGLASTLHYESSKDKLDLDGVLKIQNEEAVRFKGNTFLKQDSVEIESALDAHFGDYLEGFLTRKQLDQYGEWQIKTLVSLKAGMGSEPGPFLRVGTLKGGGSTVVTELRPPGKTDKAAELVSLVAPIELSHKIDVNRGKTLFELTGEIPSLEMKRLGKFLKTNVTASVRSPDLEKAADFDIAMEVKQDQIALARPTTGYSRPIEGLNLVMSAAIRDQDRFTLEKFKAGLNRSMMEMTAEASGKIKTKDFQMLGTLTADVPSKFPPVYGSTIKGRIECPWRVTVLHGREIGFEGDMNLFNLAWAKGPSRVSGISGRVPISEKLVREGASVRFARLITQNPFERVDYERLRPLISKANQVRVEAIGFDEKIYGPLVGYFSMEQNMISVHQFDLSLGTTGLAEGEMYLDVYPARLQLGFLARLTALNLVEILPEKYLVKIPKGDKNVSGRSGIVVNLKQGSIDGRVDITEIGGSQLITLINAFDPKYENDKMNMARSALGLGAPTFVEMSFQKGYMDMGMDLAVLGVTQRYDVRGIPLSSLVSSATEEFVKKSEEGLLK